MMRYFSAKEALKTENMSRKNQSGGFSGGGGVPAIIDLPSKPDTAIASEVSISTKSSLALTDFFAKKTQLHSSQKQVYT